MSHHTDLRDVEGIVSRACDDLEQILIEARKPLAASKAHNLACQNYFRDLTVQTRANRPLTRAQELFWAELGDAARSVYVLALLRRVQTEAVTPQSVNVQRLPLGVHTPVPDDDKTPIGLPAPGDPVDALEVDATADGAPTTPLAPKPTRGSWGELPTKPVKPRRR